MRAAGVSTFRISIAAMKYAAIVVVILFLCNEFILPHTSQKAQNIRTVNLYEGQLVRLKNGYWLRENSEFIYVKRIFPGGELHGLVRYIFNDDYRISAIIHAEKAQYQPDKQSWEMSTVVKKQLFAEKVSSELHEALIWDSQLTPQQLGSISVKPEEMNLLDLYEYRQYLASNSLDSSRYDLAFWRKLLQPIAILMMIYVGISFIFGPLRAVSMSARVVSGILLGFVFFIFYELSGPLVLSINSQPFVGAALPIALAAVLATLMMRRAR